MTPFLGGAPYRIMNSRIAKTELTPPKKKPWTFGQFLGMKSFIQFPPSISRAGTPGCPWQPAQKAEAMNHLVALWPEPVTKKIKVGKIPNKNDKFMAIYEWI